MRYAVFGEAARLVCDDESEAGKEEENVGDCVASEDSGSEGHPDSVGGGVDSPCGGLGLPKMADKIEYSRFAASEPKGKLGSNGTSNGEFSGSNESAIRTVKM